MTVRDVALRLLDHQIVGPDGQLLGNVDDLELVEHEGGLLVTGLLVGPAALAGRLPGRLGRWWLAGWRRLHTGPDEVVAVPMEEVMDIGSAVTVTPAAATALLRTFGLELWLRRHVVSRIPGAKGGPKEDDPEAGTRAVSPTGPVLVGRPGARVASDLLSAQVVDRRGQVLGRVSELRCEGASQARPRTPLRVTHLLCTTHHVGARLGYEGQAGAGPALLAALWRRRHRHDLPVPIEEVADIDWQHTTVLVSGDRDLREGR